jgi:hypothetical protein
LPIGIRNQFPTRVFSISLLPFNVTYHRQNVYKYLVALDRLNSVLIKITHHYKVVRLWVQSFDLDLEGRKHASEIYRVFIFLSKLLYREFGNYNLNDERAACFDLLSRVMKGHAIHFFRTIFAIL